YQLMKCFAAEASDHGAKLVYRSKVTGIERVNGGYRVTVEDASGTFCFRSRILINSAGLQSDRVAGMAGIDLDQVGYRLRYCKGQYFNAGKNGLVRHLVYPAPEPKGVGLGIHVTLDLEGRMLLGPDARYVDEIDYSVDMGQRRAFCDSVRRLLPSVDCERIEPEMAGIRPKLQGPGESFRDFIVRDEADRGLPGFINLVGIESPGLTASPAIARLVAELAIRAMNG
ncbi:MAG: FAD-dependent oxidoreductase, partial [Dehalococcoidia bacterium]|nr:FAD-dependent oxidoreductase [Dehalococcoidia bacterium]